MRTKTLRPTMLLSPPKKKHRESTLTLPLQKLQEIEFSHPNKFFFSGFFSNSYWQPPKKQKMTWLKFNPQKFSPPDPGYQSPPGLSTWTTSKSQPKPKHLHHHQNKTLVQPTRTSHSLSASWAGGPPPTRVRRGNRPEALQVLNRRSVGVPMCVWVTLFGGFCCK